jgi:polysaccharide biosynthesis/export protein
MKDFKELKAATPATLLQVARAGMTLSVLCTLLVCTFTARQARANPARRQKGAVASTATAATASTNAPAGTVSENYVIGPADVLEVSVWKQPDISRTVPVLPDGTISLPLIGQVKASGLTSAKLRDLIAARLKKYLSDPRVNVIVEKIESRSFNILGKVLKPGSFGLGKPTTVLDAIALAGGFQDFAKVTKIYILRRMPNGSQQMLHFNYKAVIKGKRMDENVQLQPGDTIVVP